MAHQPGTAHPETLQAAAPKRRHAVLAAFSELIGHDDPHFENLSLMLAANGRPYAVAPACDLLPMRYAPQVAGIGDPPLTPLTPSIGTIGANRAAWKAAYSAARGFWARAAAEPRLTVAIRQLATKNRALIAEFIEPLVPSAGP